VVDLLTTRIDALPVESAALLEIMACLGGDVQCSLLTAAGDYSALELESRMMPALDDGLIVLERGDETAVRFRHDRVQQAAYSRLEPRTRILLHRALARRLEKVPIYAEIAAEQYLPALELINDSDERLRCISLFRSASAQARMLANDTEGQRFLAAAMALLRTMAAQSNALLAELENEMHAALYRLGRLDEADVIYRSIASRGSDALQMVDAANMQLDEQKHVE
jgi:predicted ATPase